MTDEPEGRQLSRTPVTRGRRFKPRELALADGGRLVLGVDGSIDQLDDRDSITRSWTPDDPEWPDERPCAGGDGWLGAPVGVAPGDPHRHERGPRPALRAVP